MLRRLSGYESFAPLLLRVGIGLTFFLAGLGKVLGGTDRVAGFFGSLGVPLPGLMGPFIAYLELIGGLALIIGLLTRVFSLLFVANMLVAIVLVSGPAMFGAENAVSGFTETRTEVLLLLGSLALALLGPGALAVDNALLGEQMCAHFRNAQERWGSIRTHKQRSRSHRPAALWFKCQLWCLPADDWDVHKRGLHQR